ncbi:type II secretion system F family protein [Glaciimonas immobilis]|uniref:General secretion pathway protein F n=1 Tax=Glaciimonas immobilis TaxID=728004 RepID=A0A840RXU9_9BURK|nr:type II secretion system F family protein [Glaciimonas immobilis]KAF3998302.1 type II secretion system F family protein [Glaciimonas immobilis]MBB5201918.1 general secretion pathway protein F [Glaciimonas immobilis]
MKQFDVLVLRDGHAEHHIVQAKDGNDATSQCAKLGQVLRIKEVKQRAKKRSKFLLALFIQELIALLDAGLALVEAIEALAEKSANEEHKEVLDGLLTYLYRGQPLSQAMEQQSEIFPTLLIASVASSEHSGQLPQALGRFHHYEVQIAGLKKKVWSALMYPLIVVSVGALILGFLVVFVIPRFATVFSGMKDLNGTAQLMVWWAGMVTEHGMELLIALGGVVATSVMALRTAKVKNALWKMVWSIKRLNEQRVLFVLARFYRTFGLLLLGGMQVVDALKLTGKLLPADRQADLQQVVRHVEEGRGVAGALVEANLTTPVAARLLRVGEKSGDLAGMCERIAQFHDEALTRAIEMFSKIFEPILMLIVGGLIGTIVFLLYMPIFELAGSVS